MEGVKWVSKRQYSLFITKIYILVRYIFIIIWLKNKKDLF